MFLGFANFYRRFIADYSRIVKPLTSLTGKNITFNWGPEQEDAFAKLKSAFTSAPILRFFDFTKNAVVEPDASDFALGSILSQYDDEGILHPVAFHSRQLTKAEINYDTFDKELLGIVESFKVWRHYLIAATDETTTRVINDHDNLTYFLQKQQLSRRQYRWAEFLSPFKFKIFHRAGRLSAKPDALSRRSDYHMHDGDGLFKTNFIQLFQKFDQDTLSIDLDEISAVSLLSDNDFISRLRQSILDSDLLTLFNEGKLRDNFTLDDDLFYFDDLLVVPSTDLQVEIFSNRHSAATAGHYGFEKTFELVSRDFYFYPNGRTIIRRFIANCDICQRNKPSRHAPYGQLMPLPVPDLPWQDVSCDFITDLPMSNSFDALYVVKDRLSKMIHIVPTYKTVSAEDTAVLYLHHIFKYHGWPKRLISDRGPQFVSDFFQSFMKLLNAKVHLSSAYHPETDGSTEIANAIIEQYIRVFCSYQQDDWSSHLTLAEFTYNNSVNAVTGQTPFRALQGFDPLFDPCIVRNQDTSPTAQERIDSLLLLRENLQATLRHAQESYAAHANRHRLPAPLLQPGDQVYLSTKNLKTTRPSRKFSEKRIGPFSIVRQINPVTFELKLPSTYKIHPVFHVSLLEPKTRDIVPQLQAPPAPPPDLIDGELEYEVQEILDSRLKHRRLLYLVKFKFYDTPEWQDAENLTHCDELLQDFHTRYPEKPRPAASARSRV